MASEQKLRKDVIAMEKSVAQRRLGAREISVSRKAAPKGKRPQGSRTLRVVGGAGEVGRHFLGDAGRR